MRQRERYGLKWVTVATNLQTYQAEMLKLQLESADIPAHIMDSIVATTMPFERIAMEGARLQVPEQYAERAAEVLQSQPQLLSDPLDSQPSDRTPPAASFWFRIFFKASVVLAIAAGLAGFHYTDMETGMYGYPVVILLAVLIAAMLRSIFMDIKKTD